MIPFLDLRKGYEAIKPSLDERFTKVFEHGRFIMGPEVAELETALAEYTGTKHCIAAGNGSDTLLISLMALDIGPGEEVITTPFTFVATVEMIVLAGATPVLVDIDPKTYNMDADLIAPAITERTRAIMPVSLFGQTCDMDAINRVAQEHGLAVIEDAAQSFGATYKGRRSCGLSTIGSTSFFPSKPLGCYGDGGALFTDDDELALAMRQIRVHGQSERYKHTRIGVNSRLDSLQAAVLLAKLERFDWEIEARRRVAARYDETLAGAGLADLKLPFVADSNESVYAQYTIAAPNRDALRARLQESGIPTAVHYPIPLHLQPAFLDCGNGEGSLPKSEKAASEVISLPMGPDLAEQDQAKVCAALIEIIAEAPSAVA